MIAARPLSCTRQVRSRHERRLLERSRLDETSRAPWAAQRALSGRLAPSAAAACADRTAVLHPPAVSPRRSTTTRPAPIRTTVSIRPSRSKVSVVAGAATTISDFLAAASAACCCLVDRRCRAPTAAVVDTREARHAPHRPPRRARRSPAAPTTAAGSAASEPRTSASGRLVPGETVAPIAARGPQLGPGHCVWRGRCRDDGGSR